MKAHGRWRISGSSPWATCSTKSLRRSCNPRLTEPMRVVETNARVLQSRRVLRLQDDVAEQHWRREPLGAF